MKLVWLTSFHSGEKIPFNPRQFVWACKYGGSGDKADATIVITTEGRTEGEEPLAVKETLEELETILENAEND